MPTVIHLGHVDVVADPTLQPPSAPPQPEPGTVVESRSLTLAAAQQANSLPLLQPSWLPSAGMQLSRVRQLVLRSPQRSLVLGTVLVYRERPDRWVAIKQQPLSGIQKRGLPFAVDQGSVAGRPAVFFVETVPVQGQSYSHLTVRTALFEAGGFLIEVIGPNLSNAEVAQVGTSLR